MDMSQNKKSAFYNDELVYTGTVPEGDEYPEVEISFKPMGSLAIALFSDKIMKTETVEETTRVTAQMIADQLIEWNVFDSNGEKVDCKNVDNILRLNPDLLGKLADAIRPAAGKISDKQKEELEEELKNLRKGSTSS
jgi:hypothetical protein